MRDLIRRVRQSGYEALCVTVDVPVVGSRHRDLRSGIGAAGFSMPFLLAAACRPGWSLPFLFGYRPRFKSLEPYLPEAAHKWLPLRAPELNPTFAWADLEWVLQEWNGPTLVKGILHPDDAKRAVDMGAQTIVVSNHGGRQFDAAPSTISVLPEIRARLGEDREIHVDGGVRSGIDVLKFMASGANACWSGRAYLYGLCTAGTKGVLKALAILRRELHMAMQLAGVLDLSRETLRRVTRIPPP
jgi:isopentenyl diphosphate isomerase/L-lactate dehydrogenase-like FMN-dependent dehydrogenase